MSNANANPAVAITGLRKSYGSNEVLKGIDLQVQPGEVIAIIGKSGSGKSTLLRCINGLETFQHGSLTVQGQALVYTDPAAMRSLRQQVGMIFQSFNLFPHLTVGKNIQLAPGLVKQLPAAETEAAARRLLARVGLAEKFDAFPDQLSGGQQQRVAIARALAMSPGILLCDEITSALDPELVGEVLAAGDSFGRQPPNADRVLVEFVSANPTGPLHLGHARQAALGALHARHRRFVEALETSERALQLDPEHSEARIYLGNLLYDREQFEAALFHLERTKPEDHWDELGIWRLMELKKSHLRIKDDDPSMRIWEERLAELNPPVDPMEEMLAEIEARANETAQEEARTQLELFGALLADLTDKKQAPDLHRVVSRDGRRQPRGTAPCPCG